MTLTKNKQKFSLRFSYLTCILLTFPKAVLLLWIFCSISVLFLLCFRARLIIDALWSPAGKGLISWLSFVMYNCEVVSL